VKLEYHPLTTSELNDARNFYNEKVSGLGVSFRTEVLSKIKNISENPLVHPDIRGVRRAFLKRFPYSIIYRVISKSRVRILSIRHHRRHPSYGADRQ